VVPDPPVPEGEAELEELAAGMKLFVNVLIQVMALPPP
jgi:hypothetical protein